MLLKGLFLSLTQSYVPSLNVYDRVTDSLNQLLRSPVQDSTPDARVFALANNLYALFTIFDFAILTLG